MIVSHFELVFKPQAPGPANGVAVDRVVQGYFLEITNLETRDYLYQVEFMMAPPAVTLPERSMAGNTIYFVDTPPGTDNQSGVLTGDLSSSRFRLSNGFVRIPANGTALLAVLPSIFGSAFDPTPLSTPNFEARGHVVLKLPALFRPFPPFSFRTDPQSNAPVKVLLTPQNRATFFSATNSIMDQVQASLPIASGAALNLLEPEPGGPIFTFDFDVADSIGRVREEIAFIDAQPAELLAVLLSGFDPTSSNVDEFNASLTKAEIPFELRARPTT